MRLQRLMGLALLGFAVDASVTDPTTPVSHTSNWATASEAGISTTRLLRTRHVEDNEGEEEDEEERAGISESVKAALSKVTPSKLEKWVSKGKPADEVFTRMRLDKETAGYLLHNPTFTTWLKYVDDLNAKHPTKKVSAISTLTAKYGDARLYTMLEYSKDYPKVKALAAQLQEEQLKHWIAVAKDPDDVFRIMELDKVKKNLLSTPEFTTWAKYVDDLSATHPEKSVSMIPTLLKLNYNHDIAIFRTAEKAMAVETTKSIGTKLQDEMIKFWLNRRKTPEDALEELGLGYAVSTLFESPLFSSWLKYAKAYSSKFPEEKSTVIGTLTQKLGDENVALLIHAAQAKVATRDFATKLEAAQLELWRSSGKSVDDVLLLIDLDVATNPLIHTWVSYMNIIAKENPDKVTDMLTKLETHVKGRTMIQILQEAVKFPSMESVATRLLTERISHYLATNPSPQTAFLSLNLDNVGDNLLSDPLFTKWLKYATSLEKYKNPEHVASWFRPIREHYSVGRLITTGMQKPSTEKLAKLLDTERTKFWLDQGNTPLYMFRFLNLNKGLIDGILDRPVFKDWTKYLDDFNKRYPDQKTTMIDVLRADYNDINLVGMLEVAKKEPSTKKLATDLQSALIDKWMAKKEPLEDLQKRLDTVPTAGDMLKRYTEKLDAVAGNT